MDASECGEFLCPLHFDNSLPPIPSDPKLLMHTFDRDSFVRYRYDAEAQHAYQILAEPDLGIPIDLVDPQAPPNPASAPPDAPPPPPRARRPRGGGRPALARPR